MKRPPRGAGAQLALPGVADADGPSTVDRGRHEARNVATLGGDIRIGQVLGRAAAEQAMSEAVAIARDCGAAVTAALLVDGEAADALLDTSAERDADLIVIGARQDVSLAERILGTVATEVVRRAASEVLIVRPRTPSADPPMSERATAQPAN